MRAETTSEIQSVDQARALIWQLQQEFQTTLRELQQELRFKELKIPGLLRKLFGRTSEKLPSDDKQIALLLDIAAPEAAPVSAEVLTETPERPEAPRRRVARTPLPAHLETEVIRLEPAEKICPHCGKAKCEIGQEVTEELDYVPARLSKRQMVRPKRACRCVDSRVSIAPLPPRPIEKGRPGPVLLAQVVLSKDVDHLPLYRPAQMFTRLGVTIARQRLCDWTEPVGLLVRGIYQAMKVDLLAGDYLPVDETPVRVLDPEVRGQAAQGWLWVYSRPAGDVIFDFSPSRGQQAPKDFLQKFRGTLPTDDYGVYSALTKTNDALKRIGCWAHARRRFFDALVEDREQALWFLEQIGRLYAWERRAREEGLSPPDRLVLRQAQAPPILALIRQRLDQLQPVLLPRSLLGQAVNYALRDWAGLNGYLRDGRFEIDHNLCENSIRPTALGKKNWLFLGHPEAAWKSAVIDSIVIRCQRRQINPSQYLTDVLQRLPALTNQQVPPLVPARWHAQA